MMVLSSITIKAADPLHSSASFSARWAFLVGIHYVAGTAPGGTDGKIQSRLQKGSHRTDGVLLREVFQD